LLLVICCVIACAPAQAADKLELAAGIETVSDYRFRGVSLSDRDPAVQAEVSATLASGGYARLWGRRSRKPAAVPRWNSI
jgi:hypothetical protein